MFETILTKIYYGNSVEAWAIALGIILGAFIAGKVVYWIFGNLIKKITAKTKTKLDEKDIKDNLKRLEKYSLKMIPINFTLLKTAAGFSKKYRVSVYDATYAVIAEEKKCDLITADDKFADKINLQFVKKLSTIPNTDIIHLDPA